MFLRRTVVGLLLAILCLGFVGTPAKADDSGPVQGLLVWFRAMQSRDYASAWKCLSTGTQDKIVYMILEEIHNKGGDGASITFEQVQIVMSQNTELAKPLFDAMWEEFSKVDVLNLPWEVITQDGQSASIHVAGEKEGVLFMQNENGWKVDLTEIL